MKKIVPLLVAILTLCAFFVSAQTLDNPALKTIINNFGARNYAPAAPTGAELDAVILAGIRAPSAGNRQPWHFTVVRNQALAKRIVPQATDGNVIIIVSAAGDGKTNGSVIFDCALAVESMYLAAQALGLGSRIYTGPINNINSRFKTELGLPENHSAVALVRVGRLPAGVDALSSASPRNSAEKTVTYK